MALIFCCENICDLTSPVYSCDTPTLFLIFNRDYRRYDKSRGFGTAPQFLQARLKSCDRRDFEALSTSPAKIEIESANLPAPDWKQEVNRRLEAHKSRKTGAVAEPDAPIQRSAATRSAQAAARVAARYAKAPSYSELLAEEARSAVRAAEATTLAALEAQAAAESLLAGIEAAAAEVSYQPEASRPSAYFFVSQTLEGNPTPPRPQHRVQPQAETRSEQQPFDVLWDADLPVRPIEPVIARESSSTEAFELPHNGWWEPGVPSGAMGPEEAIVPVEPAQGMARANLIEFPREIVATRKVRPRLAEGRTSALGEFDSQLSIFEVDPDSISTEPEAASAISHAVAPAWQDADWSSIELDAQPLPETAADAAGYEASSNLELASFAWRSMAALVDGALILAAFLGAALVAASHIKSMLPVREVELGAAAALLILGALYQAFFFTLGEATPGMKYARISLCTFDDQRPTRAQLRGRLVALLLSVLPLGLGMVWAIFDEDHLSWHDRLSRTYQRCC
jgi:uncharacterized RDD family membrane protein YckC